MGFVEDVVIKALTQSREEMNLKTLRQKNVPSMGDDAEA